ncbi:hypothetical protein ACEWK1_02420 [Metabacillus sp. YM-086]|uniref:hypothetical protein n=1 Tax=Metabacillus sp. YM-086 TaxID=3341729 RepID=UPI003A8B1F44
MTERTLFDYGNSFQLPKEHDELMIIIRLSCSFGFLHIEGITAGPKNKRFYMVVSSFQAHHIIGANGCGKSNLLKTTAT